jgi:hypothetical protein
MVLRLQSQSIALKVFQSLSGENNFDAREKLRCDFVMFVRARTLLFQYKVGKRITDLKRKYEE